MTAIGRNISEPRPPALPALAPRQRLARPANATLLSREDVTATLAIFALALDTPLSTFRAGQYVSIGVIDRGELLQRPYSVVSLSQDGTRAEFFVRRLPDGRFSNLLWRQSAGTRLVVGKPRGLFVLDVADRRPRIMVGTGTGVAPLLAMLASAAARSDHTPTVLIQGASLAEELGYREHIAEWIAHGLPLDYRPSVSRPAEPRNIDWRGRTGRADAQLTTLLHEWQWLRAGGSVAYISGNPDVVDACRAVLRNAGFSEGDIRCELFRAPTPSLAAASERSTVI